MDEGPVNDQFIILKNVPLKSRDSDCPDPKWLLAGSEFSHPVIRDIRHIKKQYKMSQTYNIKNFNPGLVEFYCFSSVQLLSHVWLFATPWIAARQASLSITNPRSSLRLTSIKSVMPSSHLILGCPLLLLSPIPPSIRVFSNKSPLHISSNG